VLRSKLCEVIDENHRLHDELKKTVLQEILGFEGDVSKVNKNEILKKLQQD